MESVSGLHSLRFPLHHFPCFARLAIEKTRRHATRSSAKRDAPFALPKMKFESLYRLARKFRQKRMQQFLQLCVPTPAMTILDVGGFSGFWIESGASAQITILRPEGPENLPEGCPSNIRSIAGNGCDLHEHADHSFDMVFSNSVIEHVGDAGRQQAFAREAMRVGKSVWMQTPAHAFPIEPHLLTPFYHWLPAAMQERLFRWTVWGLISRPRPTLEDYHMHTRARLLSRREVQAWFPGSTILTERFCGLPKSYVAYRK